MILALLVLNAAAPAVPTPEQAALLGEHARLVALAARTALPPAAVAMLKKAAEAAERAAGPASHVTVTALLRVATREDDMGLFADAIGHLTRAREGIDVMRGPGSWQAADAHWHADILRRLSRLTPEQRRRWAEARSLAGQAIRAHEGHDAVRALALQQKAHPVLMEVLGDHPNAATCLNNLAAMHFEVGDHKAAFPLFRKAIEHYNRAYKAPHPALAQSLNNVATLYGEVGEYKDALRLCREALIMYADTVGAHDPRTIDVLCHRATIQISIGDGRGAIAASGLAVHMAGEAVGETHPLYAAALRAQGAAHRLVGSHRFALDCLRRAVELQRKARGPRHPLVASALNSLGVLYSEMGDDKAALDAYKEALAIYKATSGEKGTEYANVLYNVGFRLGQRGDLVAAREHLERSAATAKAVKGEGSPDHTRSLRELASVLAGLGQADKARALADEAFALGGSHFSGVASGLPERQQLEAVLGLQRTLAVRLSLGDAKAYAHVYLYKGAVLLAQRQRRLHARLADDPATRDAVARLRAVTRRLAALARDPRAAPRDLDFLTARQEQLQTELAGLSPEAKAQDERHVVPPRVMREALPAGIALIDLITYRHQARDKDGRRTQETRLSAFVIRRDLVPVRVDLGPAGPATEAVAAWRRALVAGKPDAEAGEKVKRLLWTPLEKHLGAASSVLVSPDGVFAAVPFAALPGKKPGTRLIHDLAVAAVPVPRMIPEILAGKPSGPRTLLEVAAVDFGEGAPWAPLPATGPEGDAVRKLFGGEATSLRGKKADRAAVAAALPRHRFAHLATHGYFAPETHRDALELEGTRGPLVGGMPASGWHPLVLSGVVLAGANRPSASDDGVLTALELCEMDLSKMELAVLSACETGLGKLAGGEGLLGLQRSLAVAGCRSVLASLWAVDDAATAVLMERFYHHLWVKKLSKIDALRRAQLDVLEDPGLVEKRGKELAGLRGVRGAGLKAEAIPDGGKGRQSPPAWWAAWQLSGDWR